MIAVVAATENMVGGGSYRPGDVLRAMNGKTIEITNTDAEGRLILADALHYARQQGATHLVDFATLTGAMEKALGDSCRRLRERGLLARRSRGRGRGERRPCVAVADAPSLPGLHRIGVRGHEELIGPRPGDPRLRRVVPRGVCRRGPWAHVDMAGTGFYTWPRNDYMGQKGGTGYGVRLIVELASRLTR